MGYCVNFLMKVEFDKDMAISKWNEMVKIRCQTGYILVEVRSRKGIEYTTRKTINMVILAR